MIDEAVQMDFDRKFFRANQEKIMGNEQEALRLFDACLRINSECATCLYESARILRYQGRGDEALGRLEAATKLDKDNKYFWLELSEMYFDLKLFAKASACLEKVILLDPYQSIHYQKLIQVQLSSGDVKKAIATFERIEEVFGLSPDISLEKQELMLKSGDVEGAIKELEALILQFPEEPKYYAILAELYRGKGEVEKSLQTLDELRKLQPDNAFVQLSLAEYYSEAGDKKKAFEFLMTAFENEDLDIDSKIRYLLKFYALSNQNDSLTKDAFELAKTTIRVHPEEAKAHTMLADFYTRENELILARESYRTAVELQSDNYSIWSQLILIESQLSDFKSMLNESQRAMDLFPNQVTFYYFNGLANSQLKNYPAAISVMNKALPMAELNPNLKVQLLSSLGDSYYFNEQHEESDDAYDKALLLDPNNVYVLNNYSYFLSLRKLNLDRAKSMSKKCVELEPTSPTYLDTYAWVLFQAGESEEAKKALELAMNFGGAENGEILSHYGDVLNSLGDFQGAIKYWEKAREKGQAETTLKSKIDVAKKKL